LGNFNNTVTTINNITIGGEKDNIYIGGTTSASKVTLNHDLNVLHDSSINGNVNCYNTIKATNYESIDACGNLLIGGLLNTGSVPSRNLKLGNFNNTVTTINNITIGGEKDNIYIGGTTSASKVTLNYDLTVLHDTYINGNSITNRLGVGTSAVNSNYALDINGDTHIKGNLLQDSGYFIRQF
jgi:hypothetical protein